MQTKVCGQDVCIEYLSGEMGRGGKNDFRGTCTRTHTRLTFTVKNEYMNTAKICK